VTNQRSAPVSLVAAATAVVVDRAGTRTISFVKEIDRPKVAGVG
jgi:hypothetical protein